MKDEDKDNRVYLRHILEAIDRIESFTKAGNAEFLESELQQNAVIWNIGVIGEGARQISNWLRNAHPEVPWQEIIATRNRLVHEYFNVDLDLLWEVVARDIPSFKTRAEPMLRNCRTPQMHPEVAFPGAALYPVS